MSVTNENKPAGSLDKELNIAADFPLPSMETWRKLAEASLKGGSYEKKLLTQTAEGIQLEPIYTAAHLEGQNLEQIPGSGDLVRGSSPTGTLCSPWHVAQEITGPDAAAAGKHALHALSRGQTALVLPLHPALSSGESSNTDEAGHGLWLHCLDDFSALLGKVDLQSVPLHIDAGVNGLEILAMLVALQQKKKEPVEVLSGAVLSDPVGVLVKHGRLPQDLSWLYDKMAMALNWAGSCCSGLRTVGVNGLLLREAGADVVLELAAMLSMGTMYVDEMMRRGIGFQRIAGGMAFTSGIGPFFFMEVAKFRALRALWARIVSAYGGVSQRDRLWVRAQTTKYDWTRYDRHVNLLRGTTEAFSAVVGGVDALTVMPFCSPSGAEDELARRISRNVQIILLEESHLDRVVDPVGGSYYVEWLTQQLVDRSWTLFLEMDKAGGFLEELKRGTVQERIARSRTLRDTDLAKRKKILVGVNAYANTREEMPPRAYGESESLKQNRREMMAGEPGRKGAEEAIRSRAQKAFHGNEGDVVQVLAEGYLGGMSLLALHLNEGRQGNLAVEAFDFTRLAEPFEQLRDRSLQRVAGGKKAIRVLLLPLGRLAEHKARADFSKAFMEVAGFDVVYPDALNSAEDVLTLMKDDPADIAVLCSTDDRYPEWVLALAGPLKKLSPGTTLVLAGYPKDHVDTFKKQGIDEFIYLGCDARKILEDLYERSEVK